MSPKTTSKGITWLSSEIGALLDIWADPEIQEQLAGRLHNMCIYDKISNRLSDLGIKRTGEQCREKIKKLRRDYNIVKYHNFSPAFARKVLGCYDRVDEVFGKCSINKPPFVIESLVYNEKNRLQNSSESEKDRNIANDSDPAINKQSKQSNTIEDSAKETRKRLKTLSDANKTLKNELLSHQTDLINRFVIIERKHSDDLLLQQREYLLKEEEQRREIRLKEMDLLKSFLHILADKEGISLMLE